MKKAPKHLVKLAKRHRALILHVSKVLEAKEKGEDVPDWVNRPVEYWEWLAHGYNVMMEEALHISGCYAGFHHCYFEGDTSKRVLMEDMSDPKKYKDWRRDYFVNGV